VNATWASSVEVNLVAAWAGILLGFASGLILGLFFRNETWLGGYANFKRRMYRLGHISFFGLGAVNLLFYLTARDWPWSGWISLASLAFIVGAISMPICCVLLAHFPKLHLLFGFPVLSLLFAGVVTLITVCQRSDEAHRMSQHLIRARESAEVAAPAIGLP
jgi:hypothetical protein